jgi:hypothetical protein
MAHSTMLCCCSQSVIKEHTSSFQKYSAIKSSIDVLLSLPGLFVLKFKMPDKHPKQEHIS